MRTKRRFSRRASGRKREFIWATSSGVLTLTQGGTAFDEHVLVSKTDWARDSASTTTLEKGATLQRIVGDVTFFVDAPDMASVRGITRVQTIFGLLKRDEDDLSLVDVSVDAFAEPWLQLESRYIAIYFDATPTFATSNGATAVHIPVDVRVKRKLTSDDVIKAMFLPLRQNLGTDVSVSFLLRSLIALP